MPGNCLAFSIILVIVVMVMDHIARSVIGQKLALILSCEGLEEGCNLIDLCRCQFHTALISAHIHYRLFKSLTCAIVIIRPGMLDIAKSRNLEAMTVTFNLGLLITPVIFDSEFKATVCKIMSAQSHNLV